MGYRQVPKVLATSPFETEDARRINEARGNFCKSVLPQLIREGRVTTALDVGCGALGFFSRVLRDLGLEVKGLDARSENVAEARRRNPDIAFEVSNVESPGVLELGSFDLVLCFGLLYHLENPFVAIRHLYALTRKCLLIETQFAPYDSLHSALYEEPREKNQSLNYIAMIPSEPSFVKMLYQAGFAGVYRAQRLPAYEEFRGTLTRRRVRTVLLARCPGEGQETAGLDSFQRCVEPSLPPLTLESWATWLGKLTRLGRGPRRIGLGLCRLLLKLSPPSLLLRVCRAVGRPRRLRRLPGWRLGSTQSVSRLRLFVRRALWESFKSTCEGRTFVLKWTPDIKVQMYPVNETCQVLFVGGYFDPNELSWLKTSLKTGMVFIDVGANLGIYTLFASRLVGEGGVVLALEPSQRDFNYLKANVALNRMTNVRLLRLGVSNVSAERDLLIAEEAHSGHNTLGSFAYEGVEGRGTERVRVETLDDLVQREDLKRVDAIKIDVEGHELAVLEGAKATLLKFHPTLLVEIADRALIHQGVKSAEVLSFLRGLEYRIHRFGEETGLPEEFNGQACLFDSENVLAVHPSCEVKFRVHD